MSPSHAEASPRIMIVDDAPENLNLLKQMLQDCGWRVLAFPDGAMALKAAFRQAPDLLLLDISMPGMNGYEVCRRLKEHEGTRAVPVIFLSALNAAQDKIRAFEYGGADFITKPFHFEEVKVRVDTHLKIHRYRLELERNNRALEASYRDLRQTESHRDNLVHMIVHDMRNLLQTDIALLEFLGRLNPEQFAAKGAEALQDALSATLLLREMASTVLDVSRLESGTLDLQRRPWDLREVVRSALEPMRTLQDQGILSLGLPPEPLTVPCDAALVGRVVLNLVSNALKFTGHLPGAVRLELGRDGGSLRVSVRDSGPGIPPERQARIFEKFNQGLFPGHPHSSGLGLTFAKMAVEAHGGAIGVDSRTGSGSTFWFTLPAG